MHGSVYSEYSFTAIGSEINSLFGQRLRLLRNQRGMSMEDFAMRVDVTMTELEEIEAGRMETDLELLSTMSQVLHLSLAELLHGL